MTAITPHRERKLCRAIRTAPTAMAWTYRHWLLDLHKLEETGWSPDALPKIQLANDAVALRALAEAIETTRFGLIQQQEKVK